MDMCVAAIEHSNLCMTAVFKVGNGHNLKTAFILDSGETTHICNDASRLEELDNTIRTIGTGGSSVQGVEEERSGSFQMEQTEASQ